MRDLSIIIVSWNARDYLAKCLRSLTIAMTNYDFEIIVVDNASTDGSQALVAQQFPHVSLICNDTNLGFAKANNIGISQSQGKYILLINSDVEVPKECIERMVTYMEDHSKIGMLGPKITGPDGNLQRSCMGFPTLWNTFCRAMGLDTLFPGLKLFGGYLMTSWPHNSIREVNVINGCFWIVKREALADVGLLDERFFIYAEDKDWCRRFWEAGWKVVYYPEAQAIHYGGASSAQAPIRFYIEMQRANLQYWQKYHNRPTQISFLIIIGFHHLIRLIGGIVLYTLKPARRTKTSFKIKRSIASLHWLLEFKQRGNSL